MKNKLILVIMTISVAIVTHKVLANTGKPAPAISAQQCAGETAPSCGGESCTSGNGSAGLCTKTQSGHACSCHPVSS